MSAKYGEGIQQMMTSQCDPGAFDVWKEATELPLLLG